MSPGERLAAVFAGTGFLGRRIVRHLRDYGCTVRVASRHPDRGRTLFNGDDPLLQSIGADIREADSIGSAIAGTGAVVNAVSLYLEHGRDTYQALHGIAPVGWRMKPNAQESRGSFTSRG
jgi:uncharacterized protein YbjT (DUF2867 family)